MIAKLVNFKTALFKDLKAQAEKESRKNSYRISETFIITKALVEYLHRERLIEEGKVNERERNENTKKKWRHYE